MFSFAAFQEFKDSALTVGKILVKMPTMYTSLLEIPETSIFLFGPRGTGKSTWIKENFKNAVT
jgi:predicted AAA+ superfamily ATPase